MKFQTPNTKHQINLNRQISKQGGRSFLMFGGLIVLWCLVFGIWCFASPVKIELPPETGVFKPGKGAELANAQCLVCHSVEYISTQPLLTRAAWAASVKKMREKYGALVNDDQLEPLLDYLTAQYGVGGTNAATVTPQAVTHSPTNATQAVTGSSIVIKYNCLSCHTVSAKLVGPAYKDIADKYRNDPDIKAKITEQVRKGGSGKWGPAIMPPFPQVTDEEIKVLTEWILSRK